MYFILNQLIHIMNTKEIIGFNYLAFFISLTNVEEILQIIVLSIAIVVSIVKFYDYVKRKK